VNSDEDGVGSRIPTERPVGIGTTAHRREQELRILAKEGMPVVFETRWKCKIGPLCIWPQSGRWWNEITMTGGRINSQSMRMLIEKFG